MRAHRTGASFAVLPSGRFVVVSGLGVPRLKANEGFEVTHPDGETHWQTLLEDGSRVFFNYTALGTCGPTYYRSSYEDVRQDMECFNPATWEWEELQTSNLCQPREASNEASATGDVRLRRLFGTATLVRGGMIVLGGLSDHKRQVQGSPDCGYRGRGISGRHDKWLWESLASLHVGMSR